MAAAARSDAFDQALQHATAALSDLRGQCRPPSRLEEDIVSFWRTLDTTREFVVRLQRECSQPLRQAIETQFLKVEFAADAVGEHVQRRDLQKAYDYSKARADLVTWLIESIDETISYFSTLK